MSVPLTQIMMISLLLLVLLDDDVGALDTMEIDSKGNISAAAYDASYVEQV